MVTFSANNKVVQEQDVSLLPQTDFELLETSSKSLRS